LNDSLPIPSCVSPGAVHLRVQELVAVGSNVFVPGVDRLVSLRHAPARDCFVHATPPGVASPGSEVSRGGLCENRLVALRLRHKIFQPRVLLLELFEAFGLVGAQPAVLLALAVVGWLRDADLLTSFTGALPLRQRHLYLTELLDNLLRRVPFPGGVKLSTLMDGGDGRNSPLFSNFPCQRNEQNLLHATDQDGPRNRPPAWVGLGLGRRPCRAAAGVCLSQLMTAPAASTGVRSLR